MWRLDPQQRRRLFPRALLDQPSSRRAQRRPQVQQHRRQLPPLRAQLRYRIPPPHPRRSQRLLRWRNSRRQHQLNNPRQPPQRQQRPRSNGRRLFRAQPRLAPHRRSQLRNVPQQLLALPVSDRRPRQLVSDRPCGPEGPAKVSRVPALLQVSVPQLRDNPALALRVLADLLRVSRNVPGRLVRAGLVVRPGPVVPA